MPPRNLLIVMADQLTPFMVGCYGNAAVKTPQLDRLAAEGIRFDAAYCNSPLCTPGRYAFMTGQYISHCKGFDNAAYMPSTMPTFAHYLRAMGYRTGLAGKMHFVGPDQLHGFEERYTTDVYPADFGWVPNWEAPEERIDLWYHNMSSVTQAGVAAITNQLAYDDEVGAASLRAIYDHARGTDERPFCLVASFIHPHDPYAARRKYWDLYEDEETPMPRVARPRAEDNDPHSLRLEKVIDLDAVEVSEEDVRRARRAYMANVSYVDEWLGRLRAALSETGLAEDTAILFLSDHGDMLGERGLWYKMSFYEWSVRIPLILTVPGSGGGSVVSSPVSQVDVLPTLLRLASDAAGTAIPEPIDPLDGEDLIAIAESGGRGKSNDVKAEYLAEGTGEPMLMIRRDKWKYTQCPGDPEQLFDLAGDPDERRNLAGQDGQEALILEFRDAAARHWNTDEMKSSVIADQRRRRLLTQALERGRKEHWDWQPRRDAAHEYTRSHMDLTEHDIHSRWPRPAPFRPNET